MFEPRAKWFIVTYLKGWQQRLPGLVGESKFKLYGGEYGHMADDCFHYTFCANPNYSHVTSHTSTLKIISLICYCLRFWSLCSSINIQSNQIGPCVRQSNNTQSNQIAQNQIAQNQTGPNQIRPNQIGPNQIGPDQISNWTKPNWTLASVRP